MSKVEIKNVTTKYFAKAIMVSEKIKFSQQVDRDTGEIIFKESQATCYVVKGIESPHPPKACLTLKLGNDRLFLMAEDFTELEEFADRLGAYIAKHKVNLNQALVKERNTFTSKDKAINRVKSDLAIS